jgi:glycosyltransferase involved in cell wall biosynthesis/ubiquinone/menaquinone biosynthesis C-methylase UbiE
MNICLISQEYPPDTNWGGIATYTQVLARQLVTMGQQVHVVTLAVDKEFVAEDMGVVVHRVRAQSSYVPTESGDLDALNHGILSYSQRVLEAISDIHAHTPIDVIEAPETCAQALLAFKHLKNVKTVTRCHTPFFWVRHLNAMEDNPEHLIRDVLEKMQTEISTVVTSPTLAMARVVQDKWGVNDIRVIPNFFNLKTHIPDLSVYEQHLKGKDYLLFFGRLEYRKGVHILAQALPAILARHRDLQAVFVGSDSVYNSKSMKAYISDQVREHEDRVIFIDNIPHAALYPIIEKSRFVVLPSLWENFPYACIEAMSLGKAVVASDSGGFPEIIENGKEGILCAPGDADALERAILDCIESSDIAALSRNAKIKAEKYDTEKVAQEMLDFYESVDVGPPAAERGDMLKVGYILRHFPLPSETFVINEIVALQSLKVDIYPVSLFPPEQCQQNLMSKVKNGTFDLSKVNRDQRTAASPYLAEAKQLAAKYELSDWLAPLAACVADYAIENKLEILHAHFATEAALIAMLVAEMIGVPFSFTAHAYDLFIANTGALGETRDNRLKLLVERAARVIAISEFNKRFLLERAGADFASKIDVIHCAIDTERFIPVDRSRSELFTILSVGRFVEKKGHEFLLKAFAKVIDSQADARIRLVGEGPLKPAMIELCKELGLEEKVEFLGNIPSEQVLEEMQKADAFVLHSLTAANGDMEGIPVSLMEASAVGLPVISTQHSGIPELVIDGTTGYLTYERDTDQLAAHILKFRESFDLRQRMGKAGSLYVRTKYNRFVEAAKLQVALRNAITSRLTTDGTIQDFDKEKTKEEMAYWLERKKSEGTLGNTHYQYFFTQHFELNEAFYSDKKIMDIGCGPRGSLEWATMAQSRVGLDPLADHYRTLGTDRHAMQYIASHAEDIPFPGNFFDLISSFNSLDHVNNLDKTISEIKRVLKPGGIFLLLTEVNHEPTPCEPITFSWDIVQKFTDAFELLEAKDYERTKSGIYDSVKDNVRYDHSDTRNRYGIVSAIFSKHSRKVEPISIKRKTDHDISKTATTNNFPYISTIIPVFNGEHTLDLCLNSIRNLDYPKDRIEVIVVDNGSNDKSIEIAKKYGVRVLEELEIKSSYAARNRGIQAAAGDLIAFTDADCIVTPKWLKHLVAHWKDKTIGCFAGEIEAYQPEDLIEVFSDRAGILRQKGTLTCPYLPYTQTANSAYRKTVFDKIGLFNPEMTSGGDADLAWRMQRQLGLQIRFIPEALVYHKHRTSLQGLYNQFSKYEYGKVSWHKYYPDFELPSATQRKKELDACVGQIKARISPDLDRFVRDETDLAELLSPFFRFVMSLGTYKARTEIDTDKVTPQQERCPSLIPSASQFKASVIICTYNRSDLLRESLHAVTRQDFPPDRYEIIVVDNNSTDDTRAVTESVAASSPVPIRYVFEKNQGLSFARNAGIRSAEGEVVAFVDDDIDAGCGWLQAIVAAFEDPGIACAGGPIRPIWPFERPDWLTDKWVGFLTVSEFRQAAESGEFKGPYDYPWGANIAFRREIFGTVGMFPTDLGRIGKSLLSNEELGLCRKIEANGMRIKFAPEAVILHKIAPERISKQWYYHRTYWQGRSNAVMNVKDSAEVYQRLSAYIRSLVRYEMDSGFSQFDRRCLNREVFGYLSQLIMPVDQNNSSTGYRSLKTLRILVKETVANAGRLAQEQQCGTAGETGTTSAMTAPEEKLLKRELDRANAIITAKNEEIRRRDERISDLTYSLSWKITAPLRRAYEALLKLKSRK